MKYLSLFSGIGGFELGIQQAYEKNKSIQWRSGNGSLSESDKPMLNEFGTSNGRGSGLQSPTCIGFSEIDKYAIQTYQKNFNHKEYGDITTINEKELPDFELLVGGFPCQSFSIAGKRGGFKDTRGTMFFEIARIIREKQPRLLLLENVKGLLSHDQGKTFTTIISTLDELGYDIQWQVLNSKNFGVPQNRERVFIVGHLRGTSRPEVFPFSNDTGEVIESVKRKRITTGRTRNFGSSAQLHQTDEICSTLTQSMGTGGNNVPSIINPLKDKTDFGWHFEQGVYDEKGISRSVKASEGSGNKPKLLKDAQIRRLTPKECERLQGFPDDWTEGVSDTQRYKQCRNAVTVNVIQAIMEKLL